jgi:hypothetical protein
MLQFKLHISSETFYRHIILSVHCSIGLWECVAAHGNFLHHLTGKHVQIGITKKFWLSNCDAITSENGIVHCWPNFPSQYSDIWILLESPTISLMHECSVWGNVLQQTGVQLLKANAITDTISEHFGDPNPCYYHYGTIRKTLCMKHPPSSPHFINLEEDI